MPKTSIIIVNWNGWKDTIQCLASIFANSGPDMGVVVVDNGSGDGSVRKITQWAAEYEPAAPSSESPRTGIPVVRCSRQTAEQEGAGSAPLVIIETGENLGFAGGNNVGIRYALARGAEYLLLLNNDAALLNRDSLGSLVSFMERTPKAGVCGGRLFYPDGKAQQSYGNFPSIPRTLGYLFPLQRLIPASLRGSLRSNMVPDPDIKDPFPIDYPSGAFFFVRAAAINDIGLLDEGYFMYVEEADWCYRMKQAGWERWCVPQATAMHKVAGSSRNASPSVQLYFMQSILRYYGKHFPLREQRTVVAAFRLRATLAIIGWRGVRVLLRKHIGSRAQERLDHWSLVRGRSIDAMNMLRGRGELRSEAVTRP